MDYYITITPLECDETMRALNIETFRHIKKASRDKFLRDIRIKMKHSIKKEKSELKSLQDVLSNLMK